MCVGKRVWVLLIFFLLSFPVSAQKTKAQLQKERQENQDKIKEVEKIIGETPS